MPLVFAAITPHTPLLLPSIGQEKGLAQVKKTKESLEQLEQELYLAKPDLIVIISPHEGLFDDAFVVNAHTHFVSSYEQFGDLVTKDEWKGNTDFAAKISHASNVSDVPVRLISEEKLSHGATVPLHYLTQHLPEIKILPVGFSGLDTTEHLRFGELLKESIMSHGKRVAIIASGDLAHCLTEDAPTAYNELGAQFDAKLINLLETRNTVGIAQMNPDIVSASAECGYRSILILLGILQDVDYTFKHYSYEYPLGVGYLVGNFIF
ncbi:MAG: AmmeMemoRadiSam system protein B [Candidatus Magasanikbacteria bacterium CG10_big_fil_rev_8_21_14_0_10_43_6]|uniref:AmmeMemoRadiSam system protein B n=1 Tax=Candidatus Magasanikbacteria bacterium CG10_big_fil_rev_8_21_14_0_10_43_6 TaxID=1974650 RepID=A0A2M6W1K2_9BACT|nr:MAG: AmmeMemoRadiSam system protein B [Candidatus Magasanikbacteria bacterium CG10_big_fil_rev_8_21_14_0_10_43_6]